MVSHYDRSPYRMGWRMFRKLQPRPQPCLSWFGARASTGPVCGFSDASEVARRKIRRKHRHADGLLAPGADATASGAAIAHHLWARPAHQRAGDATGQSDADRLRHRSAHARRHLANHPLCGVHRSLCSSPLSLDRGIRYHHRHDGRQPPSAGKPRPYRQFRKHDPATDSRLGSGKFS